MGTKTKDEQIYVRVDKAERAKIDAYVAATDNLDVSKLVRVAVAEYMVNHPAKEAAEAPSKIKAPGEV